MPSLPCPNEGCAFVASLPGQLKQHALRHHPVAKEFACGEGGCSFSTATRSDLLVHRRSHSDARPSVCTEPGCGKAFKHDSTLSRHRRTHRGLSQSPHQEKRACALGGCEHVASTADNLARHRRRAHDQVSGRLVCRRCTFVADSHSALLQHVRRHNATNTYATKLLRKTMGGIDFDDDDLSALDVYT